MRVPSLSTSGSRAWFLVGVGLLPILVLGYAAVTQPKTVAFGVPAVLVFWAVMLLLLGQRCTVDLDQGSVRTTRMWVRHRTVRFADVRTAELINNRAGSLLLRLRSTASADIPILALTSNVERSQAAQVLGPLADSLAQHAPSQVVADIVTALRAQADHVARGGSARQSPLAPMVTGDVESVSAIVGGLGGSW